MFHNIFWSIRKYGRNLKFTTEDSVGLKNFQTQNFTSRSWTCTKILNVAVMHAGTILGRSNSKNFHKKIIENFSAMWKFPRKFSRNFRAKHLQNSVETCFLVFYALNDLSNVLVAVCDLSKK